MITYRGGAGDGGGRPCARRWAGIDGCVAALEAHLGPGGHERLIASAAPHMPAIDAMTERLYRNFARASGLED